VPRNSRHTIAAAVLSAALIAGVAPVLTATAAAPAAVPAANVGANLGLYGVQDPTYDGVLREGYAFVALRTAGRAVPAVAVRWLLRQQCADGSFTSYRAHPRFACTAKTPNAHDTNATALAVIGLDELGTPAATRAAARALTWLEHDQNPDGGIGYTAGAATDSNSTGLFVQALVASGVNPVKVVSRRGKNPYRALIGRQVGCTGPAAERGGLAYQAAKPLVPDSLATTGGLLGLAGGSDPVAPRPRSTAVPQLACGTGAPARVQATAARAAAGYVARDLAAHGGVIIGYDGKTPDIGQTVTSVLGLIRVGVASHQVTRAVLGLKGGSLNSWVLTGGHVRPAAAAESILLARALGASPTAFGGVDYVRELVASGPHS
jgi:hypothetical protein